MYIKKKTNSFFTINVISISLVILLSTLVNHGSLYNAVSTLVPMNAMAMFMQIFTSDFLYIISSFEIVVEFYCFLNILSILLIGTSNSELVIYFLGSKNGLTILMPMFFMITSIYGQVFPQKRYRTTIVFILLIFSTVSTGSTTALIELAVLALLWFVRDSQRIKKFLNYWIFLGVYVVGNLFLISASSVTILYPFLDKYLDKGADSLKVRFLFWNKALEILRDHFFLGIGKYTERQWYSYFNGFYYKAQLHNNVIEFLTVGGIILFALYMVQCIYVGLRINQFRTNKVAYIVMISCFLAYISTLTSAIYGAEFYMIFGFAAHIPSILKNMENKKIVKTVAR